MFVSPYDFYKLSDEEALTWINREFQVTGKYDPDAVFFPVLLHESQFNYGKQVGLIIVTGIVVYKKRDLPCHFNVGAFSPDDLDCQITFSNSPKGFRESVLNHLRDLVLIDLTYKQVIEGIKERFGWGDIYM